MKRKVTIFLEPIEKEITLDDNLSEDEIEQEINNIIYDNTDIEDVIVSYWEEK